MKHMLLFFFLFTGVCIIAQGQAQSPVDDIVIKYERDITHAGTNKRGELFVNVSPEDVIKFQTNGLVQYSDFGAIGDGKTDDIDAIAAAHAYANQQGLPVQANEGAAYYIS